MLTQFQLKWYEAQLERFLDLSATLQWPNRMKAGPLAYQNEDQNPQLSTCLVFRHFDETLRLSCSSSSLLSSPSHLFRWWKKQLRHDSTSPNLSNLSYTFKLLPFQILRTSKCSQRLFINLESRHSIFNSLNPSVIDSQLSYISHLRSPFNSSSWTHILWHSSNLILPETISQQSRRALTPFQVLHLKLTFPVTWRSTTRLLTSDLLCSTGNSFSPPFLITMLGSQQPWSHLIPSVLYYEITTELPGASACISTRSRNHNRAET